VFLTPDGPIEHPMPDLPAAIAEARDALK
jgi:hypothetical protein